MIEIFINGVQSVTHERVLRHHEVFALAYEKASEMNPLRFTIMYGYDGHPSDEILPGQAVAIRSGMVFAVSEDK